MQLNFLFGGRKQIAKFLPKTFYFWQFLFKPDILMQQDGNWSLCIDIMRNAVDCRRCFFCVSSKQMIVYHQYSTKIFVYIFRVGTMVYPVIAESFYPLSQELIVLAGNFLEKKWLSLPVHLQITAEEIIGLFLYDNLHIFLKNNYA